MLGAIETGYQRSEIHREIRYCEVWWQTDELPPYRREHPSQPARRPEPEADRTGAQHRGRRAIATDETRRLPCEASGRITPPAMLKKLQQAAICNQNVFAVLVDAARWRERDAFEAFEALRARHADIQWCGP